MNNSDFKVSVLGLGYVGLPVAVHMARKFKTVGFDINKTRVLEVSNGKDHTLEVAPEDLNQENLSYSADPTDLKVCNFHIVAVPTPIDSAQVPDLTALIGASKTLGKILKKGDTVVFESTVFPGATEEVCLPILCEESGLQSHEFGLGYSPERISPGDKKRTFDKICKVVSGDTSETLKKVAYVYDQVVTAGIYEAQSIKVAEAAKIIENTQRDVNIALMNELAVICGRLGISIYPVLEAAATKWNFLKFTPGLVGGHCIGVDPYYLSFKAKQLGLHPEVIQTGRKTNDGMGKYIAQQIIKSMVDHSLPIKDQRVTVFGFTFKENCPDIRNTKIIDVVRELEFYGIEVDICDPQANPKLTEEEYGRKLIPLDKVQKSAVALIAVKHKEFEKLDLDLLPTQIIFDLKGTYPDYKGKKSYITI